jgi:hypothetical protein
MALGKGRVCQEPNGGLSAKADGRYHVKPLPWAGFTESLALGKEWSLPSVFFR